MQFLLLLLDRHVSARDAPVLVGSYPLQVSDLNLSHNHRGSARSCTAARRRLFARDVGLSLAAGKQLGADALVIDYVIFFG